MSKKRTRVVIECVKPEIDGGIFPIKRVAGEKVCVTANIFADGQDIVSACLRYRKESEDIWHEIPMEHLGNDLWQGVFSVNAIGKYEYTIQGWIDYLQTWQRDLKKKYEAGQDIHEELMEGVRSLKKILKKPSGAKAENLRTWLKILEKPDNIKGAAQLCLSEAFTTFLATCPEKKLVTTYHKHLFITVERQKALFSAWYEFFPRSASKRTNMHGTFKDCEQLLPEIARMGFDVLYLPPIHPIGTTNKKGKNNSITSDYLDPGSPWAIGMESHGHKTIHPQLGTLQDFENFIKKAAEYGLEIAMDLAFQCSMDHPYIKLHPSWFKWRSDKTIQYAENPPKKYQDIVPINFETDDWRALWEELKSIVLFWIKRGVYIFRVDNPHTKPFSFWEWLIGEIKKDYPDVLFLSESFTRPSVMYRLAKIGFSQSYTYFTWRHIKKEFIEYMTELVKGDIREYYRPNFWPNTPDILTQYLQSGGRPAFIIRLVLAATLSSNYGIYGPPFELCVSQAIQGKEEYLDSEKYEIKDWDWDQPGNLKDFISRVNQIRRENPSLQTTWNLKFYNVDNENLLVYEKATDDLLNILIIIVNLDPFHSHTGMVQIPVNNLGIIPDQPYLLHDLLGDEKYIWQGEYNEITIHPNVLPAHIFRIHKHLKRETDFDYFI